MPRILFLTTAHRYNDDRIFYHQAKELKSCGYEIKICSLSSEYQGTIDGIAIESYAILDQSSDEKPGYFRRSAILSVRIASSGQNRLPLLLLRSTGKNIKPALSMILQNGIRR